MRDGASAAGAVRTTCPYCGVGCGVLAAPNGAGGLAISGDPAHPANRGRLCVKGSALGETTEVGGRLLRPRLGDREASWDEALDLVARRFSEAVAAHGPDSVAFYVSGQLLTEDYYVANKLMKGFIGSGNIDTNSRLCMASSVAGHRRAFGADTVPGLYEDLELADLVVLTGSNMAWCHPVLHQRILAARAARPAMRIVTIDPRRTATSEGADLHLGIAPGADAHLFNLLFLRLHEAGAFDPAFLDRMTGLEAALAAAREASPAATGLSSEDLEAFLRLWTQSEKVVTVYSQGINQSDSGADKVNAILNCHLATGRIGKPGAGPFSVTGQPNAMGGREVGGLANMLACHLEIENPAHREAVRRFWGAPAMAEKPGLKAVDLFRAAEAGKIKALWILCTNPVVSMPEADRVARAIRSCDFVAVSDLWAETDTARLADALLPAAGWAEKSGVVTNSERCMSRQRPALAAPGEAKPDWWMLAQVGRRMGFHGFDWESPAAIFREYAALSGVAGALGSDFDISALAALSDAAYEDLAPFVWPQSAARQGGRFFGDGRFLTPDGKARLWPVAARLPAAPTAEHPFLLNTGRVRDQWHTMTRTGLSPRLSTHMAEPYLEIHPADAQRLGLGVASLAQVSNAHGAAVLRVLISERVAPGHPFAPMHWTSQTASAGRIDALVPGVTDPVSGQPASKSAAVAIRPLGARWHGFALSRRAMEKPAADYWARARLPQGEQAELVWIEPPEDWSRWAADLFGLEAPAASLLDPKRGLTRLAFLNEGRLEAALFVSPEPVLLARSHLRTRLGEPYEPDFLAGRPGADRPDPGPILCVCLKVGRNVICDAIAKEGLRSVEAVGAATGAGTSCGSCRPELAALIAAARPKAEALAGSS